MKRRRHSDGTFRRADAPRKKTNRKLIAEWVAKEVASRRNDDGASFSEIAKLVAAAARGHEVPNIPLPRNAIFPTDYKITERGARKAYRRQESPGRSPEMSRRADTKGPRNKRARLESIEDELALDNLRLEDWLFRLQTKIILEKHIPSIDAALRIVSLRAKINGYSAVNQVERENSLFLEKQSQEREKDLKILRAMTPEERAKYYEIWETAKRRAREEKTATSNHTIASGNSEDPKKSSVASPNAGVTPTAEKVTPSDPALELKTISQEKWQWMRDRVVEILRNNPSSTHSTAQIAAILEIGPSFARLALETRRDEKLVVYLGTESDRWQYNRQSEKDYPSTGRR
jgi:hypothetical protein